jgi:hypothetical protein
MSTRGTGRHGLVTIETTVLGLEATTAFQRLLR